MQKVPFIAIEGPIGVGKTSLASLIQKNKKYTVLNEIVDENPFLDKFYTDIQEWSFQTEMFFLCNRFKQLEDINRDFLEKNRPVVADYHILKNLIFARKTLSKEHLDKYVQIYNILTDNVPKPNVIIYLTASLSTLLSRIEMRGRKFEEYIDPAYLADLVLAYETEIDNFAKLNPDVKIIKLNGDHLDYVQNKEDAKFVLSELENTLTKGEFI